MTELDKVKRSHLKDSHWLMKAITWTSITGIILSIALFFISDKLNDANLMYMTQGVFITRFYDSNYGLNIANGLDSITNDTSAREEFLNYSWFSFLAANGKDPSLVTTTLKNIQDYNQQVTSTELMDNALQADFNIVEEYGLFEKIVFYSMLIVQIASFFFATRLMFLDHVELKE